MTETLAIIHRPINYQNGEPASPKFLFQGLPRPFLIHEERPAGSAGGTGSRRPEVLGRLRTGKG